MRPSVIDKTHRRTDLSTNFRLLQALFIRSQRDEPKGIRTHLKNRILVQDRGEAEFQTAGILKHVEDLKRGSNKDIGPKDIFEMGSTLYGSDAKS